MNATAQQAHARAVTLALRTRLEASVIFGPFLRLGVSPSRRRDCWRLAPTTQEPASSFAASSTERDRALELPREELRHDREQVFPAARAPAARARHVLEAQLPRRGSAPDLAVRALLAEAHLRAARDLEDEHARRV